VEDPAQPHRDHPHRHSSHAHHAELHGGVGESGGVEEPKGRRSEATSPSPHSLILVANTFSSENP
jgi:hypothetical protein